MTSISATAEAPMDEVHNKSAMLCCFAEGCASPFTSHQDTVSHIAQKMRPACRHNATRDKLKAIAQELNLTVCTQPSLWSQPCSADQQKRRLDLAILNTPCMESPVLVVVSYSAVPSQPGVERDATNKAPICTQQGVVAAKREQHRRDISTKHYWRTLLHSSCR